jgi:hypothetical protein
MLVFWEDGTIRSFSRPVPRRSSAISPMPKSRFSTRATSRLKRTPKRCRRRSGTFSTARLRPLLRNSFYEFVLTFVLLFFVALVCVVMALILTPYERASAQSV